MLYLSQPYEQIKDVGIVVDHRPSGDIGSKLSLALSVQRLVEVVLPLVKPVLPQSDRPAAKPPRSKVADLGSMSNDDDVWLACKPDRFCQAQQGG